MPGRSIEPMDIKNSISAAEATNMIPPLPELHPRSFVTGKDADNVIITSSKCEVGSDGNCLTRYDKL